MQTQAFRRWLAEQYTSNSANSRFSCAKRVEEQYGDLDGHYDDGTIDNVLNELSYSLSDSKVSRPNPTKLAISGNPYNVLNNFKTGVRSYKAFRDQGGAEEIAKEDAIEIAAQEIAEKKDGKQFELERHLQESLRNEINQLEPGLTIIDEGNERRVESGDIDILARDQNGTLVVIELKRGLAKREAIGQVLGYMGDLLAEEPDQAVRGFLVAGDFDKSCQGAVRVVPNLELRRYRFSFQFEKPR